MRAIKLAIIVVLGIALMMIIAANWTPVSLHLLPEALGVERFTYPNVPLALIIVAAVLVGFILAQLLEMLKGSADRRRLNQKAQEISRLRKENARLSSLVQDEDQDLQALVG